MTDTNNSTDKREIVKQIYGRYLDCLYEVDYYRNLRLRVLAFSGHFDFIIALGTALSGGTGIIGIIKNDPRMAYVCGAVTFASIIISAAKTAYKWSDKVNFASDLMQKYSSLSAEYCLLIDDIRSGKTVTADIIKKHNELRGRFVAMPIDGYAPLPLSLRREIQQDIIAREDPKNWWKPPA